jgi:2,3-bisphosphoglycerate-dependent phosphoglycerate mutase
MTRLILVRHGESMSTVERRIGGVRTCGGLSPLGFKQAEALAVRLARTGEISADVLVASTMLRALQTAEIIAPALGDLPIVSVPGVCEHEPGPDCDGLSYEEFIARHGQPDWLGDPYVNGFPGGETIAEFKYRAAAALHGLAQQYDDGTVVVVCHAGVIDVAMRSFLNLPLTGTFELSTLNTSLTELVRNAPRWRLIRYNDAAHLEGLPAETTQV